MPGSHALETVFMSRSPLPARLAIEPRGPLAGQARVPGSKSITNRALLLAALADGQSQLEGGLESDDTSVMRQALTALGIAVEVDGSSWRVDGLGGRFALPTHPLDCGNSGTTARFLTAALTIAPGPVVVDGNARMRERPISISDCSLESKQTYLDDESLSPFVL